MHRYLDRFLITSRHTSTSLCSVQRMQRLFLFYTGGWASLADFLIVVVNGFEEHVRGRYRVVAYCRRMCEAEKCFWICTRASLTRRAGVMIKNVRVAASGR
jgi:hypothetical protein